MCAAFPVYLSREVRDREKLGWWDWPGLLVPQVALLIVFALLVVIYRCRARRRRATRSQITQLGHELQGDLFGGL